MAVRNSFYDVSDFTGTVSLAEVTKRYSWDFHRVIAKEDGMFSLTTPAVVTNYAGHSAERVVDTLIVRLPQRQLVVDEHKHWPFEALRKSYMNNIEPAYDALANRIVRHVTKHPANARYGAIPGDFRFSPDGAPIFTVTTRRKDAYFVAFYSDVCPYAFAGVNNFTVIKLGADPEGTSGTFIMVMPIARVDMLLEKGRC